MGVVKDARYFYRKRAAADSAVDGFKLNSRSYFERFEVGYLELLKKAIHTKHQVPSWLVSLILYEYRWLFTYETNVKTKASILTESQQKEFITLTQKILAFISPEQIWDYRVTPLDYEARCVLQALAGQHFPNQAVQISDMKLDTGLVKISYYFTGSVPNEKFRNGKLEIPIAHAKVRALNYFGQTALLERIVWIPLVEKLAVELDGKPMLMAFDPSGSKAYQLTKQSIREQFGAGTASTFFKVKAASSGSSPIPHTLRPMGIESRRDVAERIARSAKRRVGRVYRKRQKTNQVKAIQSLRQRLQRSTRQTNKRQQYVGAWLLMDRVDAAGDNAEHLYSYLKDSRPDVNVWFVLNKTSADWERLEAQRFRLLEYGSFEFQTALCLAQNLVSSHADIEMTDPMPPMAYPGKRIPWKFTFLQHGVTQNDLSMWLNTKQIDLIITSTKAEHKSIAGDRSPYKYGEGETALTGMPRYDALRERAMDAGEKKFILISPTWRHSLVGTKKVGSGKRSVGPDFFSSEFYQSWSALLTDPRLVELANQKGLQIAFLPHPNLEEAMGEIELDPQIQRFSYRSGNVQVLYSQTRMLVTDYSSIAFDLAYIGAEIHYFQFDRKEMFGGKHTMARGYYDYDRDGFGPVYLNIDSLFTDVKANLKQIPQDQQDIYTDRVKETFVHHDGLSRSRVVHAIEKLSHKTP